MHAEHSFPAYQARGDTFMPVEALHHLILFYDVQQSARLANPRKRVVRELLSDCRSAAMEAASIPAESVYTKDLGDGAMILFTAEIPKSRILGTWLDAFHQRLQGAYERSADGCQVRMGIHAGEIEQSLGDYSSADLDFTARLVDAPIAKSVLAATPSASLAVIVSDAIYRQVVRHGAPALAPESYCAVTISVKETDAVAWLHLPGWVRVPLPPDTPAAPPPDQADQTDEHRRGTFVWGNVGVIGDRTTTGPITFHDPTGGDR
jgi:class 3 adenylate cyclase